MPRRPSKADLTKYDVEPFIQRKVELLHMCGTELRILREDPEGSDRAMEELESKYVFLEGSLPDGPEAEREYLEECERLVSSPALTHAERHLKAGAALTIVMNMIRLETNFPLNVRHYILSEYSKRLRKLTPCNPSDEELCSQPRGIWPEHVRPRYDAAMCKSVDECVAEKFLNDPDLSIEERTFIIPGDGPEHTVMLHIMKDRRTPNNPLWEVYYDDSFNPVEMDNEELKALLIDSIAWKDY